MKTQAILERMHLCHDLCNAAISRDDAHELFAVRDSLNALIGDLEESLRIEIASSKGVVNAAKTIAAMLKSIEHRPALQFPWIDKDGRQCVCDGYRAFRLKEHLPLPERPEEAGEPMDLEKLFPRGTYGMKELPMPSANDVKSFIAVDKAAHHGERNYTPVWDFGPQAPDVNAKYLLDLITILPDATKLFWNTLVSPLYATSDTGDALLLPVRKTDSQKVQPEPQTDAERSAIAAEREQAAERNAEAAARYEAERKARKAFDEASDKVNNYHKIAFDAYEKARKAETAGSVAEYHTMCVDALYNEAEWELKRYAIRCKFDPNACLEMNTVTNIVKKLQRTPVLALNA